MSILRIRYANQLAVSEYDLEDQLNLMLGEAAIAKAILGTTTQLDGFECTPTSPASLTVDVAGGTIFSLEDVLDTALGDLPTQIPADTTHQILKYAYELDSTPFTITPPATVGNSRNDLIQISFSEADGNPDDIPFFNGFTGQTINPPTFQNLNTQRIDSVTISRKQGTPAPTGTQTTPTPDAGFVGAWVVTTANGQTTITSGDITEYTGAPFLTEKLKDKISQATADARYAQLSQFTNDLVSAGYQQLPGGLIMQWGFSASSIAGTTVTFPIAFPNACLQIVASDSGNQHESFGTDTFTTTNFKLYSASTFQARWLALGH
jgi:hypothetical protein